eukprot:scaffold25197_cov53-Attheya_sp.AAC.4
MMEPHQDSFIVGKLARIHYEHILYTIQKKYGAMMSINIAPALQVKIHFFQNNIGLLNLTYPATSYPDSLESVYLGY